MHMYMYIYILYIIYTKCLGKRGWTLCSKVAPVRFLTDWIEWERKRLIHFHPLTSPLGTHLELPSPQYTTRLK